MFEAAEIGAKLSKQTYAERAAALRIALVNAQYDLQPTRSPVIVLLAGDDRPAAAGVLNRLHEWMDIRYLDTHAFGPPTEAERLRPEPWRFWKALPPRGRVAFLVGGWALSPLAARLQGRIKDDTFDRQIERYRNFEETITADGAILIKLWLHLPKREHEKRLDKTRKKKSDAWRVDEVDWRICDAYDELLPLAETLMRRTTSPEAQWHVVESTDERHRDITCAEHILDAVERAIEAPQPGQFEPRRKPYAAPQPSVLDAVDLDATLDPDDYKPRLEKLQRDLFRLAERAEERKIRTVLVFEGWDAAGKGGVIRRATGALDARDYDVVPMGAPSEEEQQYHYLWRFWRHIPRAGRIAIFDRSWYGRVLVERVEGLATEAEWHRAYPEINEFEQELIEADTVLLKFWLHIDRDVQLQRFRDREQTPYKKYKITEEDYRNRAKWDAYLAAVHDMVEQTSTPHAAWHLVPANDKRFARVHVLETLCDALRRATKKRKKN